MNLPYPLILASTSSYRKALLAQLGWSFETVSPGIDEGPLKNKNLSPLELALKLSQLKASAVYTERPEACVIGSDQVCSFEDKIFSKPGTIEKACEQLKQMQGETHELISAVTVISPQGMTSFTNTTTLHMRPLEDEEILRYVEADLPLDCAGSYKLEARGIKLFEKIEMTDHTSIIGLPLIELTDILLRLNYPF